MSDLPRCWNCQYASEAYRHKPGDEYETAKNFILCVLSGSYMWRHDYCTQHPDIQREVERLKENANKR